LTAATLSSPAAPGRYVVSAEGLRRGLLWLVGFSGAFVLWEPAPYEGFLLVAMLAFGSSLRLSGFFIPLIALLFFYHLGAGMAFVQVAGLPDTLTWTLTGIFLAIGSIFFALAMRDETEPRLDALLRGYLLGAVITSLVGILAYFHLLPGADQFMLYGRARGVFKDPNVFAPFLILPAMVATQRILLRGVLHSLGTVVALMILVAGIFLSFSRAGWGHFVTSALLMTAMTFATSGVPRERRRIILVSVIGVVVVAAVVGALLSLQSVDSIFLQRASLEQSYDVGRFGRFERHVLGFELALHKPFGIGMLQFTQYFPEDTHNTYLNAFMSYGWLGGIVFPTLVVSTLLVGGMALRRATPWRRSLICVYATFAVTMIEAWIIDVDHWRHVQMMLGLVWGLAGASLPFGRPAQIYAAFVPRARQPSQITPT
jgi:hypothetical protein